MTADMIRQLPVRRDGTGYAFILRNGLSPVIGRPPVIWHGRWRKLLARSLMRRPAAPPAVLPQAPAGPDDLAWDDTIPQTVAALAQAPAGHARRAADPEPSAPRQDRGRRSREARAWDQIGGGA
jgi:hypothetical protein